MKRQSSTCTDLTESSDFGQIFPKMMRARASKSGYSFCLVAVTVTRFEPCVLNLKLFNKFDTAIYQTS
jgi:hypothetical protein